MFRSLFFFCVGLDDDSANGGAGVEGGDRAVVGEAVVAANHAEIDDVAIVAEDVKVLDADDGKEARDHVDLMEGPDVVVTEDVVAALGEVLVGLRAVKAPHDGPHDGDRGIDPLHHDRVPLVRGHDVCAVAEPEKL